MMGHRTRGRARLGVVVPFSNTNLEPDMMMLCPPGVSVHFARAGGYDLDAVPDENQMRHYSDAPFLAREADRAQAQAIVLSRTAMRAEAVPAIEACQGKAVVTSYQAMMFAALKRIRISSAECALSKHRLAGCGVREPGCNRDLDAGVVKSAFAVGRRPV